MQNLTKNNGDKAEEHFIWQWGFFQLIYASKLSPLTYLSKLQTQEAIFSGDFSLYRCLHTVKQHLKVKQTR